MTILIYFQLLVISMPFLTPVIYGHRQNCQYPPRGNYIQWEKLEGKTFYKSMNDGDAISADVACVKLHNFTKVEDGVEATFEKYLFRSPDKSDIVPIHARNVRRGFYMLDESTDSAMMRGIVKTDGPINEKAVRENIEVMSADPQFYVTDYKNYFIVVRCSEEGRWYVKPFTESPVPTAEDVLRIWRALYKNGIDQPLFMSHCSNVL
ncbi:uncharacterized protein LOC120326720 isoform X1 [Styela clava]